MNHTNMEVREECAFIELDFMADRNPERHIILLGP